MLFYPSKIFIALSSSALILANGTIGSVQAIQTMAEQAIDTVTVASTEDPTDTIASNTAPKESKTETIGTGSIREVATPTPKPTPTPTPTPAISIENNQPANQQSANQQTTGQQSSTNNNSSSQTQQNTNPQPAAPQHSSSGTMMFYFSSYGDDAEATFNACAAEADRHGTASCNVTADDSGYLLTYSD